MVKIVGYVSIITGALALSACTTTSATDQAPLAIASLVTAAGAPAGTVTLVAAGDGIDLAVIAAGLPAGVHGSHIHAVGKCDGADFASAGPHLNPDRKMHGMDNPGGRHLGDLPNLTVAAGGAGSMTVRLAGKRADVMQDLFDTDGAAFVIHASADDYRTDPSGNSGGRVACGVLSR